MLDFLGIGAQKAGTSWVYERLRTHPGIAFPAGKEVHFWDRRAGRDEGWWLDLFAAESAGVRQGEITPAYATLGSAQVERIRDLRPDLRVFYCLRNPIERAWAHARMIFPARGLSLEPAADPAIIAFFDSPPCRSRGDYPGTLRRWSAAFGAEQVLVQLFDDLVADPRAFLVALAGHLRVDPAPFRSCPAEALRGKVLEGVAMPIRPRLRAHLVATYADDVRRLGDALGRDLGHWLAGPS